MNTSSLNLSSLSSSLNQFKAQSLQSLFSHDGTSDAHVRLSRSSDNSDIFEDLFATAKMTGLSTSAKTATVTATANPSVTQPISLPGYNVVSIINQADVSFKAQYFDLSELKSTLAHEQQSAQQLIDLDGNASSAEIKSALKNFLTTYNAGVNRFSADVARGGVLEGSQEANRARFASRRDISDPLVGAVDGLRGGMRALGITVDPHTCLASMDEAQLDAVLAQDTDADVHTIVDFATRFAQTMSNLNAPGNEQDSQLKNLDRAIHWIADNRAAVEQEFGPGAAARHNAAFTKAAEAYALMAGK